MIRKVEYSFSESDFIHTPFSEAPEGIVIIGALFIGSESIMILDSSIVPPNVLMSEELNVD